MTVRAIDRVVVCLFETKEQRKLFSTGSTEAQNANMNFNFVLFKVDDDFS